MRGVLRVALVLTLGGAAGAIGLGFLLVLLLNGHGMNATETAVSVEKGAIPASMFEPPAGYTKAAR